MDMTGARWVAIHMHAASHLCVSHTFRREVHATLRHKVLKASGHKEGCTYMQNCTYEPLQTSHAVSNANALEENGNTCGYVS